MERVRVVGLRRTEETHLERGEGKHGENGDPFVPAAVSKGDVQPGDDLESLETQLVEFLAVDGRSFRVQRWQSTSGTSRNGEGEVARVFKHRQRSLAPLFAIVAAWERACQRVARTQDSAE